MIEPTIEGTDMTGDRTAHITVTHSDGATEITRVYDVNKDISRELDRWIKKPTGKDLQTWLETKGCRLDSSDGPAFVRRYADGWIEERYFRDGKLHREAGPATIWRCDDGSSEEWYYHDGKLHREDGPAETHRCVDGTPYEWYYLDGVEYQKDEYDAKTHPLLTGLRVPLANGGQDAIETLLREAMAAQSAPPGRPGGREPEYISLPQL